MTKILSPLDLAAFGFFLLAWIAYEPLLKAAARGSLINTDMTIIRLFWMKNMARRENRFMDGQLLGHALNSASFFASSHVELPQPADRRIARGFDRAGLGLGFLSRSVDDRTGCGSRTGSDPGRAGLGSG